MYYLALSIMLFCSLQASSCRSKKSEKKSLVASLLLAVKQDKPEKVSACLRQGADPNSRDACGTSILDWACAYDKKGKIVKLLLDEGARIDARDKDGWMALDWALYKEVNKEVNTAAIKLLIQKAIDLNTLNIRGYDGKTLLHYAAMLNDEASTKIVQQLLVLGLDANAKDNNGYSPSDYATRQDVIVQLWLNNQ